MKFRTTKNIKDSTINLLRKTNNIEGYFNRYTYTLDNFDKRIKKNWIEQEEGLREQNNEVEQEIITDVNKSLTTKHTLNSKKIEQSLNTYRKLFNVGTNLTEKTFNNIEDVIDDDVRKIKRLVQQAKKNNKFYRIELILDNGQKVWINLFKKAVNQIIEKLKNGIIVQSQGVVEFSDVIVDFYKHFINSISVEEVSMKKKTTDKSGSFFPYLNISPFNLERYQIISYPKNEILQEHCLIYALQQLNIDSKKIDEVKNHMVGISLCKNQLNKISDILDRPIKLHFMRGTREQIINKTYGTSKGKIIQLALYKNHYFVYEKTNIQTFISKNWQKVRNEILLLNDNRQKKTMSKFNQIKKMNKLNDDKIKFEFNKKSKLNSLTLIKNLWDNNSFEDSDIFNELHEMSEYYKEDEYKASLNNLEDECFNLVEDIYDYTPKIKEHYTDIIIADIESTTNNKYHEMMMIGYKSYKQGFKNAIIKECEEEETKDMIYEFMEDIKEKNKNGEKFNYTRTKNSKGKMVFLIYFHNLKYDKSFFKQYLNIFSVTTKEGIIYEYKVNYKGCIYLFRDSYKLISAALSKFDKMFNLEVEKDVCPYSLYTEKNIYQKYELVENARKHMKETDYDQFLLNLEKHNFYKHDDKTKFKHMEYMKYYLMKDVEVLEQGLIKQRENFIKATNLSIFDFLTIPSLTDRYLINEHCYDNIYTLKGDIRHFVQQNIEGGRVATRFNKKWYIDGSKYGNIVDYDACSLYPSAIKRVCDELGGFPIGAPKKLNKNQMNLETLQKFNYSVVEIKITKINKHLPIPYLSEKIDGKRIYTNNTPKNNMVVDIIRLEDYINFHEIEYEIIQGVYWNNGVNPIFGEKIFELYELRKDYKKVKNMGMSDCIKLVMNSSYGKTIMKSSKKTTKCMPIRTDKQKEKFDNYCFNYYDRITGAQKVYENYVEFEELKSFLEHENRAHIGGLILSMSKRIMNEVMSTANDLGIQIFYQDTDSMHLFQKDVKKLEDEYFIKYNRVLNGKDLGQFHSDFEMHDEQGEKIETKDEVVSKLCIILGKKMYLDVLEAHDKEGNLLNDYHVRMKGVNSVALEDMKNELGSYEEIYTRLYYDKKLLFNLCADPLKPKFAYNNMGQVYTIGKGREREEFLREVKAEYPKGNMKLDN